MAIPSTDAPISAIRQRMQNDMLRRGLPYAQRLSYVLTSSLFGLLDVN